MTIRTLGRWLGFEFPGKKAAAKCANCKSGFVLTRDEVGRLFSLACTCEIGSRRRVTHNLAQWDGNTSQMFPDRLLELV